MQDDLTIFYSWQSDSPPKTNRSFIEDSIKDALKSLSEELSLELSPRLDKDTMNVPGSPNIVQTIFSKIDHAAVFIADVTIISDSNGRPVPNPNVLIELGYALKALGSDRIVLVLNEQYGDPQKLPFDLRQNRVMRYLLTTKDSPAQTRTQLSKNLKDAIKMSLSTQSESKDVSENSKKIEEIETQIIEITDQINNPLDDPRIKSAINSGYVNQSQYEKMVAQRNVKLSGEKERLLLTRQFLIDKGR